VEQAERPVQSVSYERRAPAAERRPAPEKPFEKLPVLEVVVVEPEAVKTNPETYEKIGEERTFEVDITPPKLFKLDGAKRRWTRRKRGPGTKWRDGRSPQIVRPKYKAKADRTQPPVVAPAPPRAVTGGYASAGLLAWVAGPSIWTTCRFTGRRACLRAEARRSPVPPCVIVSGRPGASLTSEGRGKVGSYRWPIW
jgi:hypothetical protein